MKVRDWIFAIMLILAILSVIILRWRLDIVYFIGSSWVALSAIDMIKSKDRGNDS
jgi:hypothetical protein